MNADWGPLDRLVTQAAALAGAWGARARASTTRGQERAIRRLVGGTGLYLEAVLKGYRLVEVTEDAVLRASLAHQPLAKFRHERA